MVRNLFHKRGGFAPINMLRDILVFYFAAFALVGTVAFSQLAVFATGLINTLPVPRYTLTSPSPLTAEPSRVLVDFSTVNWSPDDQHTAISPSILLEPA